MSTLKSNERGRPREFDVDTALDNAMLVFRERGYHAASMGELSAAMQLTTGSIYKAFIDKSGLFSRVFSRYLSLRNEELRRRLSGCQNGKDKLQALLTFYIDSVADLEGERGCLVAGSVVVRQTLDGPLAAAVDSAMTKNLATLVQLIRAGQQDGSIAAGLEAESAASLILCIVLGMRVAGKVTATRPGTQVIPLAMKILD